jgi:hypothetical protein
VAGAPSVNRLRHHQVLEIKETAILMGDASAAGQLGSEHDHLWQTLIPVLIQRQLLPASVRPLI